MTSVNRSTMSKKSTPRTPDASGDELNAADINKARSPIELHRETEAKYVKSGDEARSYESNGSETSEHLSTSSENDVQDVRTDSEGDTMEDVQHVNSEAEDEEGDVHDVYDKDGEQSLSQLHLAADCGDTDAIRRLLMTSTNVDVLDTKHNTPLHIATLNGHVDVVILLLSKNANVNSRNAFGQTALHLAAEIGHLIIAQLLLKSDACIHVNDGYYNTPIDIATMRGHYELAQLLMNSYELPLKWILPLHLAAKCGNTKDVQRLLNHRENPDARSRYGDTLLHLASQNGHFEVVEVLLRNNADANIRNVFGKAPLHMAAEMGYAEVVKTMIDHHGEFNAADEFGNTALHYAASNGHSAVVNVLLNQITERAEQIRSQLAVNHVPADEFELSQHPIKNKVDVGHTSHVMTAEGGNAEILDIQLSHSSTVSAVFKGQATPVHLAAKCGHAEIVKKLIFNGANVNTCNNAKMTPLHLACQNGHTSIVEILLDNHAIVDITKQAPETPFYLAAQNGHAGVSNLLMRRGVYDFVEIPYGYETPLQAAVEARHAEVIEVILKHSCRISKKLAKDEQTLQENSKRDVMPVELLKPDGRTVSAEIFWTERNTPLEIKGDSSGRTPLVLTALSFDPKMVQLLLNVDQCMFSDTDIADTFRSIISDATYYRRNFFKLAQFLINSSKFKVNHQDQQLNTFLHDVIRQNYEHSYGYLTKESNALCLQNEIINDVIQLLLEKGADFNMKNSYGETPLIVASEKGRCHAIQILFDWEEKSGMKLDLDARDRHGATALIKAAEMYHVSALRLLLSHKVSVNVQDNYGFTVLHAAVYESNPNWLELYFFCKGLRKLKSNNEDYSQIDEKDNLTWKVQPVNLKKTIFQLEKISECDEKATRIKEEMIQLLFANNDTDVSAKDFRENTPLDLAVKSSKQIHSATLKALRNRGAIRNSLEPEDEALIDVAWVDERGRNPLHRLIISRFSDYVIGDQMEAERKQDEERFDLMVYGILLRPENFRHVVTATDDKGRTPLHYALMPPSYSSESDRDLVRVLLETGSTVHAADIYGKTPLHYAEMYVHYKLLVQYGADENTKDNFGYTPRKLKQLRESVTMNEDKARKLTIGKNVLYVCSDIAQVLKTVHVTELSIRKLVEMIRIYSQSPRPQESSEEAVWKLWTEDELVHLNRRLSQLKILIKHFFERLAAGIKEKDWRFECQPMLVGSADEETQAFISADFDFNFILTKFSQICNPFPHPLGPKGYFQLRHKPNVDTIKCQSDETFDSFFNLDNCLLTNEVNSRFKIILQEILNDPTFWQDEHLFEWNLIDKHKRKSKKSNGLCNTVRLRMIHPIEDREGGFLFVDISVDVVACIYIEGWWPEDPLPVRLSPDVKAKGCTLVFDRPRFDPFKPRGTHFLFSETFARISFAQAESRIIKESSPLIKAAYIVCKMILHFESKTTYQLKTCLLFCMEALTARSGSETKTEEEITSKQLAFWVERIMFCFMEFSRHDIFPCYFMPSFRQKVEEMDDHQILTKIEGKEMDVSLSYSTVYDKYLDLCPDDTPIDMPIVRNQHTKEILNANHDPKWEQFDREEFIRKISSRSSS